MDEQKSGNYLSYNSSNALINFSEDKRHNCILPYNQKSKLESNLNSKSITTKKVKYIKSYNSLSLDFYNKKDEFSSKNKSNQLYNLKKKILNNSNIININSFNSRYNFYTPDKRIKFYLQKLLNPSRIKKHTIVRNNSQTQVSFINKNINLFLQKKLHNNIKNVFNRKIKSKKLYKFDDITHVIKHTICKKNKDTNFKKFDINLLSDFIYQKENKKNINFNKEYKELFGNQNNSIKSDLKTNKTIKKFFSNNSIINLDNLNFSNDLIRNILNKNKLLIESKNEDKTNRINKINEQKRNYKKSLKKTYANKKIGTSNSITFFNKNYLF